MLIKPSKKLFWFLREDKELNLDSNTQLDMYVQQVFAYGNAEEVKKILKIDRDKLRESFLRIKNFLPQLVRMFWEDYFGGS
jgi:hypothetical protein